MKKKKIKSIVLFMTNLNYAMKLMQKYDPSTSVKYHILQSLDESGNVKQSKKIYKELPKSLVQK